MCLNGTLSCVDFMDVIMGLMGDTGADPELFLDWFPKAGTHCVVTTSSALDCV